MKNKDKKTLQSKTMAELISLLREKREHLAKIRMELSANKIKNIHAAAQTRGEIAIIETIKRARQLSESEEKNG